jgi:hypothetical protein
LAPLDGNGRADAGSPREGLHLYAQCLRGHPGRVALLAINNSRTDPSEITLLTASMRCTLSAPTLQSTPARQIVRTIELTKELNMDELFKGRHFDRENNRSLRALVSELQTQLS